jgi:DNA primase
MSAPARARGIAGDDWVERVRAATDVVELISQSVALRRAGRNWVGLCPFHPEKTPSFSVNADRQFYHCFGCKAGGDVFKFVQETERVGFLEAVEMLSRRAGIPVPERQAGARGAKTPLLAALADAALAYQRWLADPVTGAGARAYLEKRGLTRETLERFGVGFAPEGWTNLADRLRGTFPEDVLVAAGLVSRREGKSGVYDRFRNRIIVPLVQPGGDVIGFGARAMGDEPPKYLNSPESTVYHKGSFLYALEQARRATRADGEMVVVEGYFDAMALHQAGVANTVATSGTALTADQARLLHRQVARVALTYDGDAAGQEAMMRSLGVLLAEGLEVSIVELPAGADPDTLVRERGVEGWTATRAAAYDPVAFVQRHVLRGPGSGDPRERALQAVVGLAAGVGDPIRVRLLLERASEVFGLSGPVLARATSLRRRGQGAERPIAAALRERRRVEETIERELLRALLMAPESLASVGAMVGPEDFRDPTCRLLAESVWSGEETGDEAAAALARELASPSVLRELKPEESASLDWAAEAAGAARRIVERRLRQELRERREALTRAGEGSDTERLSEEIMAISRSLSELNA